MQHQHIFISTSKTDVDRAFVWTYSLVQGSSPEKLKAYIEKAIEGRNAKTATLL